MEPLEAQGPPRGGGTEQGPRGADRDEWAVSLPAEGCRLRLCVPKGSAGLRPVHSRRGDSTPAAIHAHGGTRVHAGVRPTAIFWPRAMSYKRKFGFTHAVLGLCSLTHEGALPSALQASKGTMAPEKAMKVLPKVP